MTQPLPRHQQRPGVQLTDEAREFLITGFDIFHHFPDAEQNKKLWRDHHLEILHVFIAENLGKRPHAWWKWNRPPELRRQVFGPAVVDADEIDFGMPVHWQCKEVLFESEICYLHRHALLTVTEQRQLPQLLAQAAAEQAKEIDGFLALLNSPTSPAITRVPRWYDFLNSEFVASAEILERITKLKTPEAT